MLKRILFYQCLTLTFTTVFFSTAIAQDLPKENFIWKRDVQVLVGYPIVNSFKTIAAGGLYNKVDYFNSKKYPYFEVAFSKAIGKSLKGTMGFSYFQNEIIGSEYQLSGDILNPSQRRYNLYQIIRNKVLRLLFLLSFDRIIKHGGLLRTSVGLGCHIYPMRKFSYELIVSNYYSELQDSSITYFPELARNKTSYRHTNLLGLINPVVKLDYYRSIEKNVCLFLGVFFTYIYIPQDTEYSYLVFEGEHTDDYAINYSFSQQLIFGVHAGVIIHSKNNSK